MKTKKEIINVLERMARELQEKEDECIKEPENNGNISISEFVLKRHLYEEILDFIYS